MKVLYTGYYREQSEWGVATTNNILALDKQGIDVVCRAIQLGDTKTPESIKHLEQKDVTGCDIHIQHVFPKDLVKSSAFKTRFQAPRFPSDVMFLIRKLYL